MKKILIITISIIALTLCFSIVSFADDVVYTGTWGELSWEFNETTGALTISGEGDMGDFSMLSNEAWRQYSQQIKTVTIEDGITRIGERAFIRCAELSSVSIPDSVKSLGDNAFNGCLNLSSVTIPGSVKSIGENVFNSCFNLTNVELPYGLETIENYTFQFCSSLTNIDIPETVTKIGTSAFYECKALTNVKIPSSVTEIGLWAFWNCENLETVYIDNGNMTIGLFAFEECVNLKKVYIYSENVMNACTSANACGDLIKNADVIITNLNEVPEYVSTTFGTKEEIELDGVKSASYSNHTHDWVNCDVEMVQCVSDGFEGFECSLCYIVKGNTVLAHNWIDATCIKAKHCELCQTETGKSLGHSFTNYISDNNATCTADGTKTAKCDRCDETDTVIDEGTVLGHDFADATCIDPKTCKRDGCTVTEGNALGHDFADATCTVPKTCKRDGCTVTEGNALGHSFTNYVSNNDATCLTDGTKTAKCDRCDETDTVTDTDSKLGHDFADATCTNPKTCKRDGCTVTEGDALGHTYDNACDANCNVCNEARTPSSHVWDGGAVTKEPTKEEEGVKTYTCTVCGETKTESIPKLTGCGGGGGAMIALLSNSAIALVWFVLKKKH